MESVCFAVYKYEVIKTKNDGTEKTVDFGRNAQGAERYARWLRSIGITNRISKVFVGYETRS